MGEAFSSRGNTKKIAARVTRLIAKTDLKQCDLYLIIRFFMGGISVDGTLDSEFGKATDAEAGNPFHYNLVMFLDSDPVYFPPRQRGVDAARVKYLIRKRF